MTINEIIYNIRGLIKKARPDDLDISDRQLEFIVNYLREKLIVQQLQKGKSISANILQDLGQVPVSLVDKGEGVIKTLSYIFRTTNVIPQAIESDQKDLITYIGGLDKESPFSFKTKSYSIWNKHNKFSSKLPVCYHKDGHIYITNCPNPNLKFISIEGVFNNPREVSKFSKPTGQKCYNPDLDRYPISGKMIDTINQLATQQELKYFLQIVEDSTNNASEKS